MERAQPVENRAATNPFLPYDEDLFVTDISATHLCLLNRFSLVDHHLLIVTRRFESQQSLLTREDFASLWACLREIDGLGFYNAGAAAGASQPHKHLQMVPFPLAKGRPGFPLQALLAEALCDPVGVVPRFSFTHSLARLVTPRAQTLPRAQQAAAENMATLYLEMRERVGLRKDCDPYNLLVTREFMLLVPRSKEHFESIGINALGFAGSLFVRRPEEVDIVRRVGLLAMLKGVSS